MSEVLAPSEPEAVFDMIEPLEGFVHADAVTAMATCTVRRLVDKPYLQLHHCFPGDSGEVLVYCGDTLIDRAELTRGWQHSAVELKGVATPADLKLLFQGPNGEPVEGAVIGALSLSDTWGRGQRRRLKCHLPFSYASVVEDFNVHPCCGRQWLKGNWATGNTREQPIGEIWNSTEYQYIRERFLEGDYSQTCREEICPFLTGETQCTEPPIEAIRAINEGHTKVEYGPLFLIHDIDRGCNLDCIMCRNEKILPRQGNVDQGLQDIQDALAAGSLQGLAISGAGEVLAMRKVIKLLESDILSSRGVVVTITTNLTYFNEGLWRRIGHNKFFNITVSADGCSSEIYDAIRIGGSWTEMADNMRFLADLRQEGKIGSITWNYTVMRQNIADVGKAIRFAKEIGFDAIRFIAQLGALNRTEGNMFEDGDIEALDRLYEEIDAVGGFEDPRVMAMDLCIRDRRYATPHARLNQARHIFGRRSYGGDDDRPISSLDWEKCRKLVQGVVNDVGTDAADLSDDNRRFLQAFLAQLAGASKPMRTLRRLRRTPPKQVWADAVADHRLRSGVRRLIAASTGRALLNA